MNNRCKMAIFWHGKVFLPRTCQLLGCDGTRETAKRLKIKCDALTEDIQKEKNDKNEGGKNEKEK